MWHGANWTFLIWGIYNGIILCVERIVGLDKSVSFFYLRRGFTVILIFLGWVVFRADSLSYAGSFYYHLFSLTDFTLPFDIAIELTHEVYIYLIIGIISLFFPSYLVLGKMIEEIESPKLQYLRLLTIMGLLPYIYLVLAGNNYSPFLYFQF